MTYGRTDGYFAIRQFTLALVGIAIDEGFIGGVNDPITDCLPELTERNPRFTEITIRDLLMMSSGLEYRAIRWFVFNDDDPLTTYHPDQLQIALDNTRIVDPPGMEFDGSWSLDSKRSGFEKMESGVNARAVDVAKFGQLYLNDRVWNGVQVISKNWITESTQVDSERNNEEYYPDDFGRSIYSSGQGYYKYMWYGFFREDGSNDLAARADRGQIIYISPRKNLVIVRNGVEYGIPFGEWMALFYDFASEF